jgi:NitT/TauT family transport system substrate-binding protein
VGEAGIYIAVEKGYFRAEGLDVELVPVQASTDQIALLLAGELDYGHSPPSAAIYNTAARGIGVRVVANDSLIPDYRSLSSGFVVRTQLLEQGIGEQPADLRGRILALPGAANTTEVYLDRLMNKAGLRFEDVQVSIIPSFPDAVSALRNGAVDGGFLVEPFISVAEMQGVAKLVYPISDVYPGASAYALLISPQFAEQRRDTANRFMVGYIRGQRDFYRAFIEKRDDADREAILDILRKYTAFKDVKDTPLLLRAIGNTVDPDNNLRPEVWREAQEFFIRRGSVPTPVEIDRVLDSSYTDYALARLGRYAR